ncbi:glutathione S-transferase family protein [Mesorhizobium sp. M1182]|uniref:glutathione S-transferase family protein n=1 Tax=Mesorhizobium sp. M1182 TaxID=2957067 RepID=UPI003337ED2D
MYKLYWSPGSAAMAPHAILEDIGVPYELIRLDTAKGEQHSSDYLKLNPHGRVPTLVYDGEWVVYEATAICLFLTERHPEVGLAPNLGSRDRAPFLQWMAYLTNTVQEALMHRWQSEQFIDGVDHQAELKRKAEQRLAGMFRFIDEHLAKSGPYLCGARLYACDYYAVMLARWTLALTRPAQTNPHVNRLIRAVLERPGYARMLKAEEIEQPV